MLWVRLRLLLVSDAEVQVCGLPVSWFKLSSCGVSSAFLAVLSCFWISSRSSTLCILSIRLLRFSACSSSILRVAHELFWIRVSYSSTVRLIPPFLGVIYPPASLQKVQMHIRISPPGFLNVSILVTVTPFLVPRGGSGSFRKRILSSSMGIIESVT